MSRNVMLAAVVAVACTCSSLGAWAQGSAGLREEGDRWWGHVSALAADSMEGRGTGSRGFERAARYVAGEFERLGLEPGGSDGFRQPVRFVARTNDHTSSTLVLRGPHGESTIEPGVDAYFQMACAQAESLDAEAVFIGYGLVVPELGYDDLRGVDLRGRIAVYFFGGPRSVPEARRAYAQSKVERWRNYRRAGAIGWIAIPDPEGLHWDEYVKYGFGPWLALADPDLDERSGQRFAVTLNPARVPELFAGSGVAFESILALADSGEVLPRFPLAVRVESRLRYREEPVASGNVVAVVPGSDPVLRHEAVVLSAHLDHLGIVPQEGDSICNGALDNAAGVATLLEAARAIQGAKRRPKRSIVFLATAGEEHNLLGSRYFAHRPPAAAGTVVADLNVDMLLPLAPFDRVTVYGLEESSLGELARRSAARHGLETQPDPMPQWNRFIRSDQFSFILRGIPSLAFHSGGAPGSPIESLREQWMERRYHEPGDDLTQPVDRAAAARFNRFFADMARSVADLDRRPTWTPTSFFRRLAAVSLGAKE